MLSNEISLIFFPTELSQMQGLEILKSKITLNRSWTISYSLTEFIQILQVMLVKFLKAIIGLNLLLMRKLFANIANQILTNRLENTLRLLKRNM
jgi:hypothetical protein